MVSDKQFTDNTLYLIAYKIKYHETLTEFETIILLFYVILYLKRNLHG